MNRGFKNYAEEKEIGLVLYLINQETKIYRNIRKWYTQHEPLAEQAKEHLQKQFSGYHLIIDGNDLYISDEISASDFCSSSIDEHHRYIERELWNLEHMDEWEKESYVSIYGDSFEEDLEMTRLELTRTEIAMERFEEIKNYSKNVQNKNHELYNYKNKVFEIVKPKIIGYHRFTDKSIRPMYEIGGFQFHGEAIEEDKLPQGVSESEISEPVWVKSTVTIYTEFTFEEAHEILENYIYEHTATAA